MRDRSAIWCFSFLRLLAALDTDNMPSAQIGIGGDYRLCLYAADVERMRLAWIGGTGMPCQAQKDRRQMIRCALPGVSLRYPDVLTGRMEQRRRATSELATKKPERKTPTLIIPQLRPYGWLVKRFQPL